MSDIERPQLYLVTPPEFDLEVFPARLAAVLDAHEVSCVRLALATRDETVWRAPPMRCAKWPMPVTWRR